MSNESKKPGKNFYKTIQVCVAFGITLDQWVQRWERKLAPISIDFVERLTEIARSKQVGWIVVKGFRSNRAQVQAIYNNWIKRNRQSEAIALAWAKEVYSARMMLDGKPVIVDGKHITKGEWLHRFRWKEIAKGNMTMDEYYRDFQIRNANKPTHSSGYAFDITPLNPQIEASIRATLMEFKGGLVPEPDHYHIQLHRQISPKNKIKAVNEMQRFRAR